MEDLVFKCTIMIWTAFSSNKEPTTYAVKESDLTGNNDLDERIRGYIDSLNGIQEERDHYLVLKTEKAEENELSGKLSHIRKMTAAAEKELNAIRRLGGDPQHVLLCFKKVPK